MDITQFTLFGSGMALGIFTTIWLITLFLSDHFASGTGGFFWTILFVILICLWGNVPGLFQIFSFINIGLYFAIGLIFAIIRTYFKGKEIDVKDKERFDLKAHVARWWIMWPISLLNWVFGRLLVDLYNLSYKRMGKVFERVFDMPNKTK